MRKSWLQCSYTFLDSCQSYSQRNPWRSRVRKYLIIQVWLSIRLLWILTVGNNVRREIRWRIISGCPVYYGLQKNLRSKRFTPYQMLHLQNANPVSRRWKDTISRACCMHVGQPPCKVGVHDWFKWHKKACSIKTTIGGPGGAWWSRMKSGSRNNMWPTINFCTKL